MNWRKQFKREESNTRTWETENGTALLPKFKGIFFMSVVEEEDKAYKNYLEIVKKIIINSYIRIDNSLAWQSWKNWKAFCLATILFSSLVAVVYTHTHTHTF